MIWGGPGNIVEHDGRRYKESRGMASHEAREKRSDKPADEYASEGIAGLTPYKGSVQPVLRELVAGMRSGISYCGAYGGDRLLGRLVRFQ